MAWFKVDDKLWGHPKWLAASPHARALWVTAGSWCSDHLTDGEIPTHVLQTLGGRTRDARELCSLLLWAATDTGWRFNDWSEYQPSKEHVEAERKAARERQAKARDAAKLRRESRRTNSDSHGVTHAVTSPEVPAMSRAPRPDPTRPVVPTELLTEVAENPPATPSRTLRGTRIPADFEITEEMRRWAEHTTPGVDVEQSTLMFQNHFTAKTGADATKLDWAKTWQNWLITDFKHLPKTSRVNGGQRLFGAPGERKSYV